MGAATQQTVNGGSQAAAEASVLSADISKHIFIGLVTLTVVFKKLKLLAQHLCAGPRTPETRRDGEGTREALGKDPPLKANAEADGQMGLSFLLPSLIKSGCSEADGERPGTADKP